MSHVHFVLEKERIGSSLGKDISSNPLVLDGSMFIRVADPELVSLAVVVKHTAGKEVMIRGIGDVDIDRTIWACCIHDCLLMVVIGVQCEQKRGLLAVA